MHVFSRIDRMQRFIRINSTIITRTHTFSRISRTYKFRYKFIRTDLLELIGHTDLRTSAVPIGLLESKERTCLQELKELIVAIH